MKQYHRYAGNRSGTLVLVIPFSFILYGCSAQASQVRSSPSPGGPPTSSAASPPVTSTPNVPGLQPYVEVIPGTAVSFEMIPVGRGTVQTTAGEPVEVAPLWVGKTEVTWDAYDIYVYQLDRNDPAGGNADAVSRPSKPYVVPGESFGHQGNPALAMTHHAATEFAKWLSAKTGKKYRLPTEAEWEYACRAGSPQRREVAAEAWISSNAAEAAHSVGTRAPNAWGLHDMLGNVAEWVTLPDGTGVARGGSYEDEPADVTCAARKVQDESWNATDPQLPKSSWWLPDAPFVGFRIVREP